MLPKKIKIGNIYNKVTVSKIINNTTSVYKCFCGTLFEAKNYIMISGAKKSCGCLTRPNLLSKSFGKLFVIRKSEQLDSSKGILWECVCNCGKIVFVSTNSLLSNNTKSCGCLIQDNFKKYRLSIGKPENEVLTKHTQQLRSIFKQSGIAKLILTRDNFTCKLCNTAGGMLNAHHIIPSSKNNNLLLEQNNLITLCRSCHYLAHNSGKWNTVNEEIQIQLQMLLQNQLNIDSNSGVISSVEN